MAGYTIPVGARAEIKPVVGVRYASADLKRFTETGGPSPQGDLAKTVNRTRLQAGIEAAAQVNLGDLTLTPRNGRKQTDCLLRMDTHEMSNAWRDAEVAAVDIGERAAPDGRRPRCACKSV